ncbi:helix-turn-helix domain-containing protein [Micromonospora haikouensis]|uniref:helix-turn-helix domain-containing protein n=1 Tax=Micromonospora haikouensis TaxID=686309 RepID=UPI0033ECDFB4
MIDRQDLQHARNDLGRRLAALRTSRGLIQQALARQVHTTRSTLAMVERGRQVVDRIFWLRCDALLEADGQLLAAYDAYRHLHTEFNTQRAEAAQRARWGAIPEAVLTANDATAREHRELGNKQHHNERPETDLTTTRHRQPSAVDAEAGRREEDDNRTATRLLTHLRHHLLAPHQPKQAIDPTMLPEVRQRVAHIHSLYQRGNYAETIRELPDTIEQANVLTRVCADNHRIRAAAVLSAANLAASKVAVKLGDPSLAWIAADRAARIATDQAEDTALVAAAAFSVGTALLAMPNRTDSAEAVVLSALDRVAATPHPHGPRTLSTQGALTLLAALVAARQAQPATAERHLNDAYALAQRISADRNDLWTGFGPTNVMIHRINIAARTDRPQLALHLGEQLDTSSLPKALMSRRAQVHLDLAAANATSPDNDPAAVLHLLEAERIAPQTVHVHARTRHLIGDLLARERRAVTPGLRALAERAEITA